MSDPTPQTRIRIGSPFWLVPMTLGAMIFLFGLAIWVEPALLAYIVAAAFCALGLSIMGIAWKLRPRTPRPPERYADFKEM